MTALCLTATGCGEQEADGTQAYENTEDFTDEMVGSDYGCFNMSGPGAFAGTEIECAITGSYQRASKGNSTVAFRIWASPEERDQKAQDLAGVLGSTGQPYCLLVGEGDDATWVINADTEPAGLCDDLAGIYGVDTPIRG